MERFGCNITWIEIKNQFVCDFERRLARTDSLGTYIGIGWIHCFRNDNPISEEGLSCFVLESKFCICHCETVEGYYALNLLCQLNFDMHFTAAQTSVTIILRVSEGRYRKILRVIERVWCIRAHHTDWLKHTLLRINQMTNQNGALTCDEEGRCNSTDSVSYSQIRLNKLLAKHSRCCETQLDTSREQLKMILYSDLFCL